MSHGGLGIVEPGSALGARSVSPLVAAEAIAEAGVEVEGDVGHRGMPVDDRYPDIGSGPSGVETQHQAAGDRELTGYHPQHGGPAEGVAVPADVVAEPLVPDRVDRIGDDRPGPDAIGQILGAK